ncbi:MAG: ATP-binding protein [bacterium]|nr:ATP-binding protein [bacterium]
MKNIIGPPVTGDDFFGRENELARMNEILANRDASILIPGPRRIGKTSLTMEFIRRYSNEYMFVYFNLQSRYSILELYNDIIKETNTKVDLKTRIGDKTKGLINNFSELISEINLKSVKVKPGSIEPNVKKVMNSLEEIFEHLSKDNFIFIFDEFSDFIINLRDHNEDYRLFLEWLRKLRQAGKIRLIITGSINLISTAEELKVLDLINDPAPLEIAPLTRDEVFEFLNSLIQDEKIKIPSSAYDFVYEKLSDGVPFYIRLFAEGLIQYSHIDRKIKNIYEKITDKQHIAFEHLHSRLDGHFKAGNDNKAAKILLSNIVHEVNNFDDLYPYVEQLLSKAEANKILKRLTDECYILHESGKFKFVSPMLADWWKKAYGFERSE